MASQKQTPHSYARTPAAQGPDWLPIPKWIRASLEGKFLADSKRVRLLRGRPPVYYFPSDDIEWDFLQESDHTSSEPALGEAKYWHVTAGDRTVKNAAWQYTAPPDEAPPEIDDYVAFDWEAVDTWWEEDEPVRVHPRDPFSRLDALHSSRHIEVHIGGVEVADTTDAVLLFETGLPVRYYLPKKDIRMELLQPTDLETECPYKGIAQYYSAEVEGEQFVNIAWSYPFPNPTMYKIQDLVAFYSEKLDHILVDGQPLPED